MKSLRVESVQQARKMIRDSALGFYAVAGIHILASFMLGVSALIDGALFAVLGCWLQRTQSRNAATLLLILAAFTIVTTVVRLLGAGQGGGNIILAVIAFWLALRAAVATHKLTWLLKKREAAVG